MRIFICHASEQRVLAEQIALRLRGDGHRVFQSGTSLQTGEEYDRAIRSAIERSRLFVFLISPQAVSPGRYTLTELGIAQAHWEHPGGRVLPVMAVETSLACVPEYLKAVTILNPSGLPAPDVAHSVERMRRARRRHALLAAAVAIGLAGTSALIFLVRARPRDAVGPTSAEQSAPRNAVIPLPEDLRHRVRTTAAVSSFFVALADPPQVARIARGGTAATQIGELPAAPVAMIASADALVVACESPDGIVEVDPATLLVRQVVKIPSFTVKGSQPRETFASRPISLAASRREIWVVTRGDNPALIRVHEGRAALVPYSTDFEFGSDLRNFRLVSAGDRILGVGLYTPHALFDLRPDRFEKVDGHHDEDAGCIGAVVLAENHLRALGCGFEQIDFDFEGGKLRVIHRAPALGDDHSTVDWDVDALVATSAGTFASLTQRQRGGDYRAIRADVVWRGREGRWSTLFSVPDEAIAGLAALERTALVQTVHRGAERDAYWVDAPAQ